MTDFKALQGKHLTRVVNKDNEEILFFCEDGSSFKLYHDQDCCESVTVEEIVGDLADLTGLVVEAEEVSGYVGPERKDADSYTWTFYKLGTTNGSVTIRWYGESNGYYSESVTFTQLRGPVRTAP